MAELAVDVLHDWERGQEDRGTWLNHWQRIVNYLQPNRADYIIERAPGQKRNQWIVDAVPPWALEQYAAGLHSYLTSPFLQWFSLAADEDWIDQIFEVRQWFDIASQRMYEVFNGPQHNFASQSQEIYLDLGAIGNGTMAVLESARSDILFSTRHMKECVWLENEEDRIDQVSRRFRYTAKQAVEAWGRAAGEKPNKAFSDGKEGHHFWFHHRVKPRKSRDPQRREAKHKPFESVYVSESDKAVITEGGFDEFPYLCPRLEKASGETYGRGRGTLMLPHIQMLNEMGKTVLKGAQKVVDPPLMLPDDGFMVPIKTTPGSLNYYRAGTRPTDRIAPIETKGQIQLGLDMIQALRSEIIRGFYVEFMMMPSDPKDPAAAGKGVTATYVLQQRDEKMRLLSPMLARLQTEFLDPLIKRVFAILWRKSVARRFGPGSPFPLPPAQLRGADWHVQYVSPIAVAQRSSQLEVVDRLMARQLQFLQMQPSAPMVMDVEATMRLEASDLNAPVTLLKSPHRMQQEQQAQQKMIAQQHQAEVVSQLAGAAKDGGAGVKSLSDAGMAGNMQEAA